MKRIIQKICLCIGAVLLLLIFAAGYQLFHDSEKPSITSPTVVDPAGNVYDVYEEGGKQYVVVTGANGEKYIAETNPDKSPSVTVKSIGGGGTPGNVPQQTTNPPVAADPNQTTAAPQPEQTAPQQPAVTDPPQRAQYNVERYRDIFASGVYKMEFTTNDEELGDTPVVCAVKNGNFLMDTTISGMACKMLYIKHSNKTYLVLDSMKRYCQLPDDVFGDDFSGNQFDMMSGIAPYIANGSIKTENINLDGKDVVCESYTSKDGTVMKYYFDGGNLVRIDSTDKGENGAEETLTTFISYISGDVPDSTFEVPPDYRFINLSFLGGLM